MRSKLWSWIGMVATLLILAAIILILVERKKEAPQKISAAEEAAAGEALLIEKLSGPRYFNVALSGISNRSGAWIEVEEAWKQLPGIVAERKLGPEGTRRIGQLIESMAEPHPSRSVGGERIRVTRLNLALDAL